MAIPVPAPKTSANTERRHPVSRQELPLSCPSPAARAWSLHPRVYLPIEATGVAVCPYCGAQYELID